MHEAGSSLRLIVLRLDELRMGLLGARFGAR